MCMRVFRRTVLIGLLALTLMGCGRQVTKTPRDAGDLLATGPDQTTLAVRPDFVLAAVEAAGGLPAWMQCKQLSHSGIVTIYRPDGSYYLTEHAYTVYPWSNAVRISAREPRSTFVWQMVGGQFRQLEGDRALDVSPLAGAYPDYAAAVLQIMTAPARLLGQATELTRQPLPVQIRGQQYDPIGVRFQAPQAAVGDEKGKTAIAEPYWTNGVYFQNRQSSRVEMIWLAHAARRDYLVVRGYDYAPAAKGGVLVPTKIEIFRSDAEGGIGRRLIKIDLVM
jgi:hypothetical protein